MSKVNEEQPSAVPSGQPLKDNSLKAAPSFTAAPWHYYTGKLRPQFSTIIHEIQDAHGTAIVAWSGFDGVDFSQEQIASNARLIAAAPELYEALKGLMVAYGAVDGRNGNSGKCWDDARAALAKVNAPERNTETQQC